MSKFKIGDQVEVVNYGSLAWRRQKMVGDEVIPLPETEWYDPSPDLVGERGIVTKVTNTQGVDKYSLTGTTKSAWYYNDQLKLIVRPKYK